LKRLWEKRDIEGRRKKKHDRRRKERIEKRGRKNKKQTLRET